MRPSRLLGLQLDWPGEHRPRGRSRRTCVLDRNSMLSAGILAVAVPGAPRRAAERSSGGHLADLATRLRFIREDRLILALVLTVMVTNVLDAARSSVLHPACANEVLGGACGLGLMFGASEAGRWWARCRFEIAYDTPAAEWLGARATDVGRKILKLRLLPVSYKVSHGCWGVPTGTIELRADDGRRWCSDAAGSSCLEARVAGSCGAPSRRQGRRLGAREERRLLGD